MTEYDVRCECGRTIPVQTTQAGTLGSCSCGKPVQIPSLSGLRRAAGQTPIPQSLVERIRSLISDGTLPDNSWCPITDRPVHDTIWLQIQCERVDVLDGEVGFLPRFFLWFLGLDRLAQFLPDGPRKEYGRDIAVKVPLGISHAARSTLTWTRNQKTLKEALSHTPIYSQLLLEYPAAEVWVIEDARS